MHSLGTHGRVEELAESACFGFGCFGFDGFGCMLCGCRLRSSLGDCVDLLAEKDGLTKAVLRGAEAEAGGHDGWRWLR